MQNQTFQNFLNTDKTDRMRILFFEHELHEYFCVPCNPCASTISSCSEYSHTHPLQGMWRRAGGTALLGEGQSGLCSPWAEGGEQGMRALPPPPTRQELT